MQTIAQKITSVICVFLAMFLIAFGREKYQTYQKPNCEWCGTKGNIINRLNVHHLKPQHLFPELAQEESNCVTLCRQCHFVLGHKRNWTNYVEGLEMLIK